MPRRHRTGWFDNENFPPPLAWFGAGLIMVAALAACLVGKLLGW